MHGLDQRVEFALTAWNQTVEVHKIFSECTCLVETAMFDPAAWDNFVWWNTENLLGFQLFQSKNDSERHADWQSRGHRDCDQIQKFNNHILSWHNWMQLDDEHTVWGNWQAKKKDKKLGRLLLELVLLLPGKRDDSDKLTFEGYEICSYDTHWNAVCLPKSLKLAHFLFHVNLYDCRALENIGTLVKLDVFVLVLFQDICFLDHRNWLSSQCTFVD